MKAGWPDKKLLIALLYVGSPKVKGTLPYDPEIEVVPYVQSSIVSHNSDEQIVAKEALQRCASKGRRTGRWSEE